MVDHVSTARRSEIMASIHSVDTVPELTLRRMLHRLGYRYRIHVKNLPGSPDLVFPGRKKIIFVHGCFWHRHKGCSYTSIPKTRTEFWVNKFEANVKRDRRNQKQLKEMGWRVKIVWECELKHPEKLVKKMVRFLDSKIELRTQG
ncbi:MAG: very short patch repair endonuclease [Betaproteobacteria bacterium HGW-Betaproteobacteria-4]|jgi:DNA mismatch endonuclease (patch repair protein)|nr:MAG: very short patch repair endonuclease [Betaproteobacteria bacterium HGW-Betaproteobacteria-4]